ncbi:hypothetical protein LDL08_28610 [Nonomuraea glycinis]|uniref:Uncharacterized protein n=1 Tax=Nonomuraea glycinis TaxID=2047744 RepID=A0A918E6D8_9ACTN|nr:DUF6609 family protein [Nonomuraea glycinis]MCA2180150.1 hypothetical protein [Nonomuraea glycinis]GGP10981.1 hypothetical protein GCM10012278_52800 [Nonomuraea glycinis]
MSPVALLADLGHPYPLIRGGGLFLLGVGTGFLLSWIFNKHWLPFVIGGFVTGFVGSGLSALLPSLGTPSIAQIGGLVGAFVLEGGLIYLVLTKTKDADDYQTTILWILFVVGVHFVPMGLAHGPLISMLGVLTMANAYAGMRLKAPLPVFGVIDALLKFGFGAVMLFAYPALTFA